MDEVKIDRSFVDGMVQHSRDRSIVRSTIAMAQELRLLVVVEGVETEDQLEMLRRDDCDRAQGYLIAKPLSEGEFVDFVRGAQLSRPAASLDTA